MPPVGSEPATLARAAQTLTQLTKWPGRRLHSLCIGTLAKIQTRFRQAENLLFRDVRSRVGTAPHHFTDPDMPGRRRASQGSENENENKMGENEK